MNTASQKRPIKGLSIETREDIRQAVDLAMTYWPNANDDLAPREYLHSAFRMLRSHADYHGYIQAGIGALSGDAYRYADM